MANPTPIPQAVGAAAVPATPTEQMTDEWLRDQWERAVAVASMGYGDGPEGVAALLRGFANRVLQQFGDREGMRDALNIGYTKMQAERTASPSPASTSAPAARVVHYPEQGAQFNKVAFLLRDVPAGTYLFAGAPDAAPVGEPARVVEIDYESRKVLVRFADAIPAWLEIGPVSLATPTGVAADESTSAAPDGWNVYEPATELPAAGTEVLLWAVEDFWDDEQHVIRGAVHMGEVREHEGIRHLWDYMDTTHSHISHWRLMPNGPAASPSGERTSAPAPEGERPAVLTQLTREAEQAELANLRELAKEYDDLVHHMDGGGDFHEFMRNKFNAQYPEG